MTVGLEGLRRLAGALGDALTLDEVARATLAAALEIPGVFRAGLALNRTAGRHLQFVSSDADRMDDDSVRWCLIDAYETVPLVDAVRSGQDIFLDDVASMTSSYPAFAARQLELGTRGVAALALATGHEHAGGLLLTFDAEGVVDEPLRRMLDGFAIQVTQALRKALVVRREHTSPEQLQRILLPHTLPDLDGVSFGAHYQPGGLNTEVGGDWYDVITLPDGSAVISIGDVMGKGVDAAIAMSEVRAAIRAYAALDPRPSVVLSRMDDLIGSRDAPEQQLVTAVYGVVSPDRRRLTLAVAGHPAPLLVTPTEPAALVDGALGPALGLAAGPWPEVEVELPPHSTLLLYSDGLVSARSSDIFSGIEALIEQVDALPRRRRRARDLCAQLRNVMAHEDAEDDVAMLAMTTVPVGSAVHVSAPLPADTTAPSAARRFVRDRLEEWRADWRLPDDLVDTAELCVSELVTNAVIHTGTSALLTVELDHDCLTALVRDQGGHGVIERAVDTEPLRVSGRGLGLVEALAEAWGAERDAEGTTVWFELDTGAVEASPPAAAIDEPRPDVTRPDVTGRTSPGRWSLTGSDEGSRPRTKDSAVRRPAGAGWGQRGYLRE